MFSCDISHTFSRRGQKREKQKGISQHYLIVINFTDSSNIFGSIVLGYRKIDIIVVKVVREDCYLDWFVIWVVVIRC